MKLTLAALLLASCTQMAAQDEKRPTPEKKVKQSDLYASISPQLSHKTNVPLRLPNVYLAYADDQLYAILEVVEQSDYEIQIALSDDCPGGNYCHVGTIRGSSAQIIESEGPKVPVILRGGIRGYFVDATCYAFCDDSAVGWSEGIWHYSISLKAARKQVLVKLANSVIASSRMQKR